MVYKVLPTWDHHTTKLIHLILHAITLVLCAVEIYCAFKFHSENGIANLYSLHSWLGIGTICLYGIQTKQAEDPPEQAAYFTSEPDAVRDAEKGKTNGVKVVYRTKELEEQQAWSRIWNKTWLAGFFYKPCNYELFVKQSLNMEMAIVMAWRRGMLMKR